MPPERFEFDGSLVDETESTDLDVGPVTGSATVHVEAGQVYVIAEEDLEHLHAAAGAEATTAEASAQAQLEAPLVDLAAAAEAQGPSAHAQGEIGPDGVALSAGASVYTVGAEAGADIAGEQYSVAAEAHAGWEMGIDVAGPTVEVDAGFVGVQVPNPVHLALEGIGSLVDGDDSDDHAVTTDQHGGPSHHGPPGSHIID